MKRVAICILTLLPTLALAQDKPKKLTAGAIQIEPIEAGDIVIPAEFRYAIYERLIERVKADGEFKQVLRSGDRTAQSIPDLVVLHTKISRFKQGSQTQRELTTVTGGTQSRPHGDGGAEKRRSAFEQRHHGPRSFLRRKSGRDQRSCKADRQSAERKFLATAGLSPPSTARTCPVTKFDAFMK